MQKNGKQGEKNTKICCFFGLAKHLGIGDSLEICGAGFPATCAVLQYSRYGTQSAHSQHSHTSAHSGHLSRIFLSKMGLFKNIVYRVRLAIFAQYRVHIACILKKNIAQACIRSSHHGPNDP